MTQTSKPYHMATVVKYFNDGALGWRTFSENLMRSDLTKLQREILFALYRRNKGHAITQVELEARLHTPARQIREAIAELRVRGAMIASGNDGFWVAQDREEMKQTIESQYTKQALNMLWKARVMRDHTIHQFGGHRVFDLDLELLLDDMSLDFSQEHK